MQRRFLNRGHARAADPQRSSFGCARSQSADVVVNEEAVRDGDGNASKDAGGHERAPEVNIGPDQIAYYADRNRFHGAAAHEDEGVEKLIPTEREAEDA